MFRELLETVAANLHETAIPYMVIGGQAVLLHGEPRLTKDIDITLGANLDRLQDVLGMVRRAGLTVLVDPEQFTRQTMVLPCLHTDTGIRVDFIFSFSAFEQQAIEHSLKVRIGNSEVCFATVEDVVIHKVIAGRARDLEDVRSMVLKNPRLNADYVRRWLEQFSSALDENFVKAFENILEDTR